MKIRFALIFIFSVLVSLCSVQAQEAGTFVRVEGDRVNMRASASLKAEVVGQVEFDTELVVKDGSNTNWLEIVPPANISFWVSSAYVKEGVVTARKLNVRAGASVNYSIVGRVHRREKVMVRGRFNDWLEIAPPPASSLWVSREFLFIPPPPFPLVEEPIEVVETVRPMVVTNVPLVARVLPTPVPPPHIPPVAPSSDIDLVPLPGQGRVVRREGTLRAYLLKGGSPSKYYLSAMFQGRSQLICYVENKDGQLRAYKGKRVLIQGHEYWVQGVERPVIVPRAIIAK